MESGALDDLQVIAAGHRHEAGLCRLAGGWSVAAEDFAVWAVGFGGAVGVEDEVPAEAVDANLMVVLAEQDEVRQAGPAAVGAADDVVDVASGGGPAAAAGPCAVPVAEDDRAAQVVRDAVDLALVRVLYL